MEVNEAACDKAIEGAFNIADASKKGYITRKDYKIAVTALLGYKPSKFECDRILSEHGSSEVLEDGSAAKIIPMKTFKALMIPKIYQRDSDELIRQIFLALDIQCRGFLTIEEVIQGFHEIIPTMPQHQVKQFFKEIDLDEDGRISYKDFELMMKQRKLLK
ncbi:EF-hand calcium-binding domain-containing protein 11-like [Dysidea avara]|uniref:EF-hand calcium-binding domain-containing protein 11-like n=1 Tax=Dysidea avara TaxID=196820 RepID=UPI00332CA03D